MTVAEHAAFVLLDGAEAVGVWVLGAPVLQPTDSRGWRVDAPISLRQWHELNGHPPRRGSRRRK